MTGRVAGKVALITGAARGQGRSHAIRLAEEGADIIALDIAASIPSVDRFYPGATEEDLAATVKAVEALDRRIFSAKVDVRDYDALKTAVDTGVAELGRLDVVAANAGIFLHGDKTHEVSEGDWDDVLDINLKGVWHTAKATVPILIAQGTGGSIVITSSTAGLKGMPNIAPYAASKHAVLGLARSLSNELGQYSIRVNTIHPGSVATQLALNDATYRLFRPDLEQPTREQAMPAYQGLNSLPIPWVEPIDISNALLFLASDEARYVTGTELKVDAGATTK